MHAKRPGETSRVEYVAQNDYKWQIASYQYILRKAASEDPLRF